MHDDELHRVKSDLPLVRPIEIARRVLRPPAHKILVSLLKQSTSATTVGDSGPPERGKAPLEHPEGQP